VVEFKSWRSYWNFELSVKRRSRYIHDDETKQFLEAILCTSEKRRKIVQCSSILWRAQIGHAVEPLYQNGEFIDEIPSPYPPERMKPVKNRAKEGRANPKGIPYLYLSTNRETALSEVRPWIGSLISVAQFRTKRDLKIVNCTVNTTSNKIYFEEPSAKDREQSVWTQIDKAFAKPVDPSDDIADYVPTQIIAELFRENGFDGLAYRSSLGKGHNIVLFDLNLADLINCFLFEVKSIDFHFEEAGNPYFMKRPYKGNKSNIQGT